MVFTQSWVEKADGETVGVETSLNRLNKNKYCSKMQTLNVFFQAIFIGCLRVVEAQALFTARFFYYYSLSVGVAVALMDNLSAICFIQSLIEKWLLLWGTLTTQGKFEKEKKTYQCLFFLHSLKESHSMAMQNYVG